MVEFFDQVSESLAKELPTDSIARVFLNLEDIRIAQGYVTAKVENRYGDMVSINIQPGKPGIMLHETLFNLKGMTPGSVYVVTTSKNGKEIVRKLSFDGFSDWLLIFDDTLFLEAAQDGCSEMEVLVV